MMMMMMMIYPNLRYIYHSHYDQCELEYPYQTPCGGVGKYTDLTIRGSQVAFPERIYFYQRRFILIDNFDSDHAC